MTLGEDTMGLDVSPYEVPASWCVLQEKGKQYPTLF